MKPTRGVKIFNVHNKKDTSQKMLLANQNLSTNLINKDSFTQEQTFV